ncbi:hypothetical protein RSOLAG22IIIB_07064 [Rhizoctonia solani]|uniref:Transmembrane protein n=1 Tax=Rhizoctonia solani TaxID=456999 RepID=A0A0K6GIY0_9AGAM|nr:hypothetical protein RSOLAG22IIIB_07064 [Rhizoctonia solani]
MYSSRRLSFRSLLYIWILGTVTERAGAQQTTVTCDRSFDWVWGLEMKSMRAAMTNSCWICRLIILKASRRVLSLLTSRDSVIQVNVKWNVTSLPTGTQYIAPTNQEVTGCACSSPVYALLSACAACQGRSYVTWGQWTSNCPTGLINNGSFPFQVPTDTEMPQWALKSVGPESYFDLEAAKGGGSDSSLSGATVFLIVLLPILLVGITGIATWVWWQRRKRRAQSTPNQSGKEPLLRPSGSRHTFISVNTASDIHIQLSRQSMDSLHSQYGQDKHYAQPSPVPTTPESLGFSSHPSPAMSSPGAQYAYYPEFHGRQTHQPFLAPPSATTSFGPPYQPPIPTPPQPPHTGSTTKTFASQMKTSSSADPIVIENDSGTFPRTPVEPVLPTLPLGDMRRLLPPSVRANERQFPQ